MTRDALVRGVLVVVAASAVLAATASRRRAGSQQHLRNQTPGRQDGVRRGAHTDTSIRVPRADAKGNPVRVAKATGHVSNYNEDKVGPYTLPDPLVTASGQRISSAELWFKTLWDALRPLDGQNLGPLATTRSVG